VRKSFILVIANIKYVTHVITIRLIRWRGSVLIAENIMRLIELKSIKKAEVIKEIMNRYT